MLERWISATAWTMTPPSAYGSFHLLFLFFGLGTSAALAYRLRRCSAVCCRRILLGVGLFLIVCEAYKLLMLSRGYEGRMHLAPEELLLFDIADSVCDLVGRDADAANMTICNQISPGLQITADQSLPTQLFMNLIGNAVKYGKTSGHVWLDAERKLDGVQILISDDGLGISEEDQAHIFERFYRADRSRDRTGTGLGLSIVQWIAELHGGSVSVRSALGHGSCFTVTLPDAAETKQR